MIRGIKKDGYFFENGCLALPAMMVLHLCKVSCLCRCIVQRLGSADISVLASNFWQATKASLLWAQPQGGSQGRQSPYPPPAWMPGVYAQGLCKDAKPTKHTQPFSGKGAVRHGCRNKDTPSFKHGCLQVVEQSRYARMHKVSLA